MQLAAALDDWADKRRELRFEGWRQLLAMARVADPDLWRDHLRDALEGKALTRKALDKLIDSAERDGLPPSTALLLANGTRRTLAAERVLAFLRQVRQRHPADQGLRVTPSLNYH